MKIKSYFAITLSLFVLCSCNNSSSVNLDYLSVKLAGSELWSIIDLKTGEIVLKDEFKNAPSAISDGIFVVENSSGKFDYFSLSDVKKPLNSISYIDATTFKDGKALATLSGKPISLINSNGQTIREFSNEYVRICQFSEGLAVFQDQSDKFGYINEKGDIVIKAQYNTANDFSDGIALCKIKDESSSITKTIAIDKTGKEVFSFTDEDYSSYSYFSHGYLPVIKGGELLFLDKQGRKTFSVCNVKKDGYGLETFYCSFDGKYITFMEGDLHGIKDKDNNIILRAKYNNLNSLGGGRFIATKEDKKGIINYKDEVLLDFKYDELIRLRNNVYLVKYSNTYTLIDETGKDLTVYNFKSCSSTSVKYAESNYIEPNAYAKKLFNTFTRSLCGSFTDGMTLYDFKSELGSDKPSLYKDEHTLEITRNGKKYLLVFENKLAKETYKYYYGYRFHDDWTFNFNTKLMIVCQAFEIKDYPNVEEEIGKAFDQLLVDNGYSLVGNYIYKNKEGHSVGLEYENGGFVIWYWLYGSRYLDIPRVARKIE